MQELKLRDFRCFHEEQAARLAPLTLLVGENSTGKTSFLAAVRAILEVANGLSDPDFRAPPYDLGSFREVAHRKGPNGRLPGADSFDIGCRCGGVESRAVALDTTFTIGDGAAPTLVTERWSADDIWIREHRDNGLMELGCSGRAWRVPAPADAPRRQHTLLFKDTFLLDRVLRSEMLERLQPMHGEVGAVSKSDRDNLLALLRERGDFHAVVFAGAPIRSSPIRTYDPVRIVQDPQGFSMPALLAHLFTQEPKRWQLLKEGLEEFGRASGLFDEIFVKRLGRFEFDPFQLEVRKWGKRRKGPKRNLIDVGYGVSQILPLLVDLANPAGSSMFLLQQPEVHLHQRAQAELGSLFCSNATSGRQLIIETHSEYIIDRVRMDLRDHRTDLKPEDVSILFFERDDLEVRIHSLRFDELGNVLDAPNSYGQFFMNEMRRSVGL